MGQMIDPERIFRQFPQELPEDFTDRLSGRPLMEYAFYQRASSAMANALKAMAQQLEGREGEAG